jgi:hypothetical protein
MKKNIYFIMCLILLSTGSLFFLYQESWIIFFIPHQQTPTNIVIEQNSKTKEATLWAFNSHTRSLKKESIEMIYSDDIAQNLKLLINNWFLFLEEEGLIDKQIIVQSVALCENSAQAFVSINQYPFDKSMSTYQKLMIIESLLKTIRDNNVEISAIRLLIHHKQIVDDHLNFNISWPIQGYLK